MEPSEPARFARLSDDLRDAFAMVAAAPLEPEVKARWQKRLIAITNAAKRDTARAEGQLRRFHDDWEGGQARG